MQGYSWAGTRAGQQPDSWKPKRKVVVLAAGAAKRGSRIRAIWSLRSSRWARVARSPAVAALAAAPVNSPSPSGSDLRPPF